MNARIRLMLMAVIGLGGVAEAQAVPDFYNRGGVAMFSPVVRVVPDGAQMLVAPTVSADRKYVTMGMSAQVSHLIRIESFPVMSVWPGGVVGNVRPAAVVSGSADSMNASVPVQIRPGQGGAALSQVGMTRLASLK